MGNIHFNILPMTPADIPEILTTSTDDPDRWNSSAIREELELPSRFHFTARKPANKKILAFIMGRLIADEAEIFKVVVRSSYQRQAIGTQILSHTLKYLKTKKTVRCFLELRQSNIAARNLYEKSGFKLYSSRKKYYSAPSEDAWLMEKSLQPAMQTKNSHPT